MSEFKSLAEEVSQFYDSPYKFVVWAFDWGYGTLKGFDGPDEWAQSYLLQIGSQVKKRRFNGVDAVEPQRYAVASGHGIGKLHSYNVIVPTPSGKRRWGDLNIGDMVFGGDGYPTQIIGTKHYKDVPMYRVSFDDGSYCDVSSGHLWNVRGRQERRNKKDSWRTLETIDILEIGVKRHNGCTMAKQWEIPIQGAAQFEEREVDLHPYLVGIWLGDGSKGQPIYKAPEIAESYLITNSSHLFKEGVFTLGSHERYIPDEYKYNTIKNRMELFKGLCDSDGEVHASGSIGYSTTSKRLADDIIWLSRSLGCKAQLQDTVKQGWYSDEGGERVECRDCYRVTINSPFNPFTLDHRKERYKPSDHRYLTRWIDSIEPIDNADGMCITVSNADGLYLANDFIPTHNSCLTAWLILWIMSTRPNCKGIVTANTSAQLESKTWAELAKWRKLCKTGDWFELNSGKGSLKMYHKEYPETWRVDAQTCREENSESFAGLHAAGSTPFYLFDESSAIPDKIWEVAEGGMTDGEPMWFVFGNPTRNTGRFRECFGKNKHRWFTRQIDSRDVKITNKTQIKQWVDDYGEDSDFVRVRVKGEFPRAGSMQFISSEDVEAARKREPITSIYDPCVLGIDVARFGDDETVLCIRRGRDARSVEWVTMRGACTMTVAARAVDMINLYSPDMCFVDEGGVGGGVVDRLNQLRYSVIGVQFGGKSDRAILSGQGAVGYKNKRAEMWGNMKEWLKGGSIPDDPDLASQLTGVEYGYVLQGGQDVIVLERKEDMKKRGLSSPDKADALCLTFSYSVNKSDHSHTFGKNKVGFTSSYDPLDDKYILNN